MDSHDIRNFNKKYKFCPVWGILFKKSVIENLRFNTNYYIGEDSLFFYSALKKCKKVKYTENTVYCYVINSTSLSHGSYDDKKYTEIFAWKDICDLYADNAEIRKMFEEHYIYWSHHILNMMRDVNSTDTEKIVFLKNEIRYFLQKKFKFREYGKLHQLLFVFDAFMPEKINIFIRRILRHFTKKNPQ